MTRNWSRRGLLGSALALTPALTALRPIRERLVAGSSGLGARGGVGASDYLLEPGLNYLNHASIGTVPAVVHRAQVGYSRVCESNPWLYVWGDGFRDAVAETRRLAAEFCGIGEKNLAITRGTTEVFNVFAQGLPLSDGDEVVFSELNHVGASACWDHQAERSGFEVRRFPLPIEDVAGMSEQDLVDLHVAACGERTRVLVLPHIDNVVGVVHPIAAIARAVKSVGVDWVLVDGAQSVGAVELDLDEFDVDGYATSAHKWIQSPKGLGLAYLSDRLLEVLQPMIVSWGRSMWSGTARSLEDYGTRDFATILALGDALRFSLLRGLQTGAERLAALRAVAQDFVESEPRLRWMSPRAPELQGTLWSLRVEGAESTAVAGRLFEDGRTIVRGHRGAHDCLRVSPGYASTEDEVLTALRATLRR